jgi:2-polyprenyl-6-methoxyphenol hydroxylase-like FAD-dependent oxidoreductase
MILRTFRKGIDSLVQVSAKYIVGCDGSHSRVRRLLGSETIGDKGILLLTY